MFKIVDERFKIIGIICKYSIPAIWRKKGVQQLKKKIICATCCTMGKGIPLIRQLHKLEWQPELGPHCRSAS